MSIWTFIYILTTCNQGWLRTVQILLYFRRCANPRLLPVFETHEKGCCNPIATVHHIYNNKTVFAINRSTYASVNRQPQWHSRTIWTKCLSYNSLWSNTTICCEIKTFFQSRMAQLQLQIDRNQIQQWNHNFTHIILSTITTICLIK